VPGDGLVAGKAFGAGRPDKVCIDVVQEVLALGYLVGTPAHQGDGDGGNGVVRQHVHELRPSRGCSRGGDAGDEEDALAHGFIDVDGTQLHQEVGDGCGHDVREVAVGRDDTVLELVLARGGVDPQRHSDDQSQDDGCQEKPGGDPHAVAKLGVDVGTVGAAAPVPASDDAREPFHVALPRAEVRVQALEAHGVCHLLRCGAGNAFLFQQGRFQGTDSKEVSRRGGQEDHKYVRDAALCEVPEHGTSSVSPPAAGCRSTRECAGGSWYRANQQSRAGSFRFPRVSGGCAASQGPCQRVAGNPLKTSPVDYVAGHIRRGNYHMRPFKLRANARKTTSPYQIVMNEFLNLM
jgi:hypothetical protein